MWPNPEDNEGDGLEETILIALHLPKSLHAMLAKQAEVEGVSINTLAVALLAEGLERKQRRDKRRTL